MGRVSEFACPSCNMSWELQLGHGIGHATLESVLGEFPPDIRQKILADTQGEQYPAFGFQYCPAVCGQCRKVTAVPVISLHQAGRSYVAACPDCGNPVAVQAEGAGILCPHCGEGTLSEEDIGRWD